MLRAWGPGHELPGPAFRKPEAWDIETSGRKHGRPPPLKARAGRACVLGHPWLPGADARIGDGAAIGRAAVIGAGAILPPGAVIADGATLAAPAD